MSRDLTPAAVIHRLDHGGSISLPATKRFGTLILALVTGLFLLWLFILLVIRGGIQSAALVLTHDGIVETRRGFALSQRRLHPILVAAHARYSGRIHDVR